MVFLSCTPPDGHVPGPVGVVQEDAFGVEGRMTPFIILAALLVAGIFWKIGLWQSMWRAARILWVTRLFPKTPKFQSHERLAGHDAPPHRIARMKSPARHPPTNVIPPGTRADVPHFENTANMDAWLLEELDWTSHLLREEKKAEAQKAEAQKAEVTAPVEKAEVTAPVEKAEPAA
jgi:hypothetical protein